MRYRFRIVRTQFAERVIRASDEDAAMDRLREELNRPYGFFGRWEDASMDVELPVLSTAPVRLPRQPKGPRCSFRSRTPPNFSVSHAG